MRWGEGRVGYRVREEEKREGSKPGDKETMCPKWLSYIGARIWAGEGSPAPEREGLRVVGGARSVGRSHRDRVRLVSGFSKT